MNETSANDRSLFGSPLILLAGLILVAGLIAVVVVVATGGDGDPDADPDVAAADADVAAVPAPATIAFGGEGVDEVAPVTITGTPLAALEGTEDLAIGTAAPVVTAQSLANGASIELGPGRARVIGFFAHWCPHCQAELPELVDWLESTDLPDNTEFIAVSTVADPEQDNWPPSAWFNDEKWPQPVIVDDDSATLLQAYGFSGFPAFIAIDAEGTVIGRATGNIGAAGVADLFSLFAADATS